MGLKDSLLCGCVAVALPIGQALFKWAAVYDRGLDGAFVPRLAHNYPLMGAFAWYGLTALLWFHVLTRVPLSLAYTFSILGSALVPLIAWLIFKEPLSWAFALGYGLMIAGFAVIMLNSPA
jgi:drug/metabolite transporter (DMT)-like permease